MRSFASMKETIKMGRSSKIRLANDKLRRLCLVCICLEISKVAYSDSNFTKLQSNQIGAPPLSVYAQINANLRPPDFLNRPVIGRPPRPPNSAYSTTPRTTTIPWYWTSKTTPSQTPAMVLPVPKPVHVYIPADTTALSVTLQPAAQPTMPPTTSTAAITTTSPTSTTAAPETTTSAPTTTTAAPTTTTTAAAETTTRYQVAWQQTTPITSTTNRYEENNVYSGFTTAASLPSTTTTTPHYNYYTITTPVPQTARPPSRDKNYTLTDGSYYYEYLDANGQRRIEQGYFKKKGDEKIFVKQGSYVMQYSDNKLHRISYIADEYGYRIRDDILPYVMCNTSTTRQVMWCLQK